jgi:hypothetical protein
MNATAMRVRRRTRAPRFRVPNQERAIISTGTERLGTTLDCLSLTGGRIRSARRFAIGTFADLEAKTVSGNFTAAIELLGEARGGTQAFRFVQMGSNDRRRLQDALNKMQEQGLGEKQPTAWDRLFNLGRGVLISAARK